MADRFKQLLASDLLKAIRKKHGKTIITPADDFRVQKVPRISTGVFFLNYALGGGVPAERVNIVWGHKSTGKTVICLRTMGNAQKLCANCFTPTYDAETGEVTGCQCGDFRSHVCAFLDVEGTWDQEWARLHGVDTSRVLLSVPEYAEQTLDIAEALVLSGEVDLLVIDSLAFLTPTKEIEESTAKALQAEQARVLGRGIRKFVSALNKMGNQTGRRPTLLFTNQIRMKVGQMFGNPETQPGGHAPGFSATTETKCYGGKYEMDDVTGVPIHVDLKYRVEKNKSSGAKMEGDWRLMLADTEVKQRGQVYEEPGMVEMAIKVGLVDKEGGGWSCLGEKYRSKSLLVKQLATTPAYKKIFGDALMAVLRP